MADPITALGLMALIATLIEHRMRVSRRLREYNAKERGKLFNELEANLELILDIWKRIKDHAETGQLPTETERVLVPVIESSRERIDTLYETLDKVVSSRTDSRLTKNFKAVLSIRYESTIKSNKAALQEHLAVLMLHLAFDPIPLKQELLRKPVSMVPFDQDMSFLERKNTIKEMEGKFKSSNRLVLAGMRGVG